MNFTTVSPFTFVKFEGKSREEKVKLLLVLLKNFREFHPCHGHMNFRFLFELEKENFDLIEFEDYTPSAEIFNRWNRLIDDNIGEATEDDFVIMEVQWNDEKNSFVITISSSFASNEEFPVTEEVAKDVLQHIIYLGRDVHEATIPEAWADLSA